MAREIYNKNAREKVLLEQAYMQVYPSEDYESEEGGTFEGAYISGTDEVEPQPDLSQLEGSFQAKKNPSVKYRYRVSEGETIPSLEPNEQGQYVQDAPAGNIILTGHIKTGNTPDGEQWSQKPEKFEKDYKKVSETEAVAVGANPVAMRQLTKPFKVHTSWGSVLEGKPGDLLTMYGPNDYGVLDQDAFKAYYIKA